MEYTARSTRMEKSQRPTTAGYVLVAALGATAGAIAVVILTRAIPTMVSRMMSGMMERMAGEGCDPEEL
jgi:hypothetical protein